MPAPPSTVLPTALSFDAYSIRSSPPPASILSTPAPPSILSLPFPVVIVSFPDPPSTVSLPALVVIISSGTCENGIIFAISWREIYSAGISAMIMGSAARRGDCLTTIIILHHLLRLYLHRYAHHHLMDLKI